MNVLFLYENISMFLNEESDVSAQVGLITQKFDHLMMES